jgi:sucrose phosphorylase
MRLGDRYRLVWTTFTSNQLDLNIENPLTWDYLTGIIDRLTDHGVRVLRFDAIGYIGKAPGTSCWMTDAAKRYIARLAEYAHERGAAVLVELHGHFEQQIEIARSVDLVYDFALPPLVIHTITTGDVGPLARWVALRPTNTATVLDTHDGIGLVDVGPGQPPDCLPGLLTAQQMSQLIEAIHDNSGGVSRLATGTAAANLDIYQVNCTFYDALGRDDKSYLLARALQLFLPGIPQVYYVGLLAGSNDTELLSATGAGRDVNRHYYSADEIECELARPVVQAQLWLLRLRANHLAFAGEFSSEWGDGRALLRWRNLDEETCLEVDVRAVSFAVWVSFEGESARIADVDLLRGLPSPDAWQTVGNIRRDAEETQPQG